jgi:hypothetical protein
LLEWQKRFGTEKACVAALTKYRWLQGFMCPKCGHDSSCYNCLYGCLNDLRRYLRPEILTYFQKKARLVKLKLMLVLFMLVFAIGLIPLSAQAKSRATVKRATIRDENPKMGKEWLILPYAFSTDDLGTVFGVGGGAKGYWQEQLLIAGSVFGGPDDTYGIVLGAWDYQPPWSERFFLTAVGSYGHYQKQRAYTALSYDPDQPRRGSNDSDEDDFVVTPGFNNWSDFRLEYVLPIGAARQRAMMTYHLKGGILTGDRTGGYLESLKSRCYHPDGAPVQSIAGV